MGYKILVENILNKELNKLRNHCPMDITDKLFCIIEAKYINEYNSLCGKNNCNRINRNIGKHIKKYWGLKNKGRHKVPVSSLIKSYEKHSN